MTRPTVGEYQLNFTINYPRALRMCRAFKFTQLDFDAGFSKSEMHHVACGCTCCQCVVMSCFIKNFMVRVTIWRPGTCKSQYQGPFMMMQHWSVQPRSHLEKRWKESNSLYEKISEFPRPTLRSAGWWNVPAIIRKMAYRCQWQNTETHQHTVHLWDRNKKAAGATRSSF